MKAFMYSACVFGLLAGSASAEVITGDYPTEFLNFTGYQGKNNGGYVAELDLNFCGFVDKGGGFQFAYLTNDASPNPNNQNLRYLSSDVPGSSNHPGYFTEGQSLSTYGEMRTGYYFWKNTNSGKPDFTGTGPENEVFYFGFSVLSSEEGADPGMNFGFLQLFRSSSSTGYGYEVQGWAYETEAGVDLTTFDVTVPSPASAVILGMAGLCVPRRRRS